MPRGPGESFVITFYEPDDDAAGVSAGKNILEDRDIPAVIGFRERLFGRTEAPLTGVLMRIPESGVIVQNKKKSAASPAAGYKKWSRQKQRGKKGGASLTFRWEVCWMHIRSRILVMFSAAVATKETNSVH